MDELENRAPGTSRVGQLFSTPRVTRGLRIVEVARLAGLGERPKTLRNIGTLERTGEGPTDLVRSVAAFFKIDLGAVKEAWKLDETDRKQARWEACGGRPFFILRAMPGVYQQIPVPEALDRETLIEWSRTLLREEWGGRHMGCLNFSPDEIIWFETTGSYHVTHDLSSPSMSVRGKNFILSEG